jgi:predicted nucleotidyltransferase
MGLFGSCAKGEDRPDSDLDFVVELEAKSFDSYMGLHLYLEELFGKKVDLILIDSIKPRLRDRIMEELVYATGL